MLASLIIVPLVSLVTQKSKPEGTEEMFSCYNAKVLVPAKDVLTDSAE